jgi:hypothetical protein
MSVKAKLLAYLSKKSGWNTLSVAQAVARFRTIPQTVYVKIHDLREEGYPIYTNLRHRSDGSKVMVYRMGTPSRAMKAAAKARGIRLKKVS